MGYRARANYRNVFADVRASGTVSLGAPLVQGVDGHSEVFGEVGHGEKFGACETVIIRR